MSQLNVDTIKKADGTGNLSVPANTGTLVDTSGATFTGAIAMGANNISFSNGNGIDFSASEGSGATSSILDDYEEGTWTPTYNAGGTAPTYSNQIGVYVKTGKFVLLMGRVKLSNKGSGTGGVSIEGLPFTIDSTANLFGMSPVNSFNLTSTIVTIAQGVPNSSQVQIKKHGTDNSIVGTEVNNNSDFRFTVIYRATS